MAPAGAATVAVLTSRPMALDAMRPVTVNVARSPASSVTVVARLPVPEASGAARSGVGGAGPRRRDERDRKHVGHARGGHRTRPGVGHHDRVGDGQSGHRAPGERLGDRQVGDRLRGQRHGRRVVRRVGVRLIAGGDARRVGDRARLRDARRERQPRAAGVRDRSDGPDAGRAVVRALRRDRRLERRALPTTPP